MVVWSRDQVVETETSEIRMTEWLRETEESSGHVTERPNGSNNRVAEMAESAQVEIVEWDSN